MRRRTLCAGAAQRGRTRGADVAHARRCACACRRRLSRMARRRICQGLRRSACRRGDCAGAPRAARPARQHAEGRAGQAARLAAPSRREGDAVVAAGGCASSSMPMRAVPASRPSPISSRARSRCRTKARSLPRCSLAAKSGEQVIDLCAGAGGKTLALAAMMGGRGRLIATDRDKRQLAPIHERLSRAGVHNADVRTPKDGDPLARSRRHIGSCRDRRAVHRHRNLAAQSGCEMAHASRRARAALKDQIEVLDRAARLVKPGGRIAYITCSVLPQENGEQIRSFISRHPGFEIVHATNVTAPLGDRAIAFRDAATAIGGRCVDDATADENRRVFRICLEKTALARAVVGA